LADPTFLPGRAANLLAIEIPDGLGGTTAIVMDPLNGRDQIVAMAALSSWTSFERPLPTMFHSYVTRKSGVIIDVGANSGFYSLLAMCASTTVQVLAFEPDETVFNVLRRNISANRAWGQIEAVPLALSSSSGVATLYVPTQEHGLLETSSSLEQAFKEAHSEARVVKTTTLDAFLADHQRRKERVTLVKVDVEGHEAEVLKGARETIARWRPLLFIEVLPRFDPEGLAHVLAEHDYVDVPLFPEAPLKPEAQIRWHDDAWNHALVPAEAAEQFLLSTTC
jgi:FkbM family methyltransferase